MTATIIPIKVLIASSIILLLFQLLFSLGVECKISVVCDCSNSRSHCQYGAPGLIHAPTRALFVFGFGG